MHELAAPYPLSETSPGHLLDRLMADPAERVRAERAARAEFARDVGGEVR